MLAKNGALADIIAAGARVLECACGPCIGMGQSPESNAVSVRTFNRNFHGQERDGWMPRVYLVSPEVAACSRHQRSFSPTRHDLRRTCRSSRCRKRFSINDNLIEPAGSARGCGQR